LDAHSQIAYGFARQLAAVVGQALEPTNHPADRAKQAGPSANHSTATQHVSASVLRQRASCIENPVVGYPQLIRIVRRPDQIVEIDRCKYTAMAMKSVNVPATPSSIAEATADRQRATLASCCRSFSRHRSASADEARCGLVCGYLDR
jgi:hypothetical protein